MKALLIAITCLVCLTATAQVQVHHLRCEMLENPVGVDAQQPRISWQLSSTQRDVQQTAYEIIAASSREKLAANAGDLWQSGKVSSTQNAWVSYAGKALAANSYCYWKVKVYTNKGVTGWSEPAYWLNSLQPAQWKAKWIGMDSAFAWDSVSQWSRLSARYAGKVFTHTKKVKQAVAYIAGVGLYELYMNGNKVGSQVLSPAPTDYRKAVLYNSYDVTALMQQPKQDIMVALGNGRFFTMRQNYKPAKINTFGYPKLLFQLELTYTDGTRETVISDGSWKLNADGPIRSNNEYDGETYDANKALTGKRSLALASVAEGWMPVQLVAAPGGVLKAQVSEPMRVMKTLKPVSIRPSANGYILDMGQNFAGWLQMKVQGKQGDKVTMRFAESLQPNGNLYTANLRDARATNTYTLKGGGVETWHPAFVYQGFRYVEVTGFPGKPAADNFEGQLVYDALETTGQLQTSDTIINKIIRNAWWGIASNYKGMPVDCPQRNERQPWLGDRATGALGESFLFGNGNLYAKWLDDIEDAQTAEGAIPDVAPAYWNYYSDNVTWPGTYLMVADMLYKQYGNAQPIVKHYASMKKWMRYMQGKYLKNYLLTKDKYGDWCVPPEDLHMIRSRDSLRNTNGTLIATATYYQMLQYMQQFAKLAGQQEDVVGFATLADSVKKAFHTTFYRAQQKCYDNNTATANLLPLYYGMVPAELEEGVFNSLYNTVKITNHMHVSTGVIGIQYLMRGLTRFQRSDIAYTLASNKTYPSWGYMTENGASTIWELWNGNTADPQMNSQNHVMLLGDLLVWLFENAGGIQSAGAGFRSIVMKPENMDGLTYVNASYQSVNGAIVSNWQKKEDLFNWQVTIPANTQATLYIPANDSAGVTEGGKPAAKAAGVRFLRMEGRTAVYSVASGSYHFSSALLWKKGIVTDEFIFSQSPFPESHSSTIAETPKGLIAAWFGGTKEGNKDVEIYTSRLVNGQWTTPVSVANGVVNDSVRIACYNPVLYQVPHGDLLLFYKIGNKVANWKGWMIRSKDNGISWSSPEALPEGFLGPIKNKPVQVGNVLICPSSTEGNGWRVHFETTTDEGKTWNKIGPLNDGKTINAIQPSILHYADGRLQILCRTRNRSIAEAWSSDGGKTWGEMKLIHLPNNNSGTDAITLKDGRQLLVYNHVKPDASLSNGKGPRTPLNVALSKDGKTWYASLVLEDSPVSQYSYPSVMQSADGMVHIVYTWRRERIKYVKIDPAKLEMKEIINEQWPGAAISPATNASHEEP
ncbi:alpha-L-rhamnosidase [Filimonas lacunae]|uniref:alpha-L-rhamnosidase n=1 Tax=Filimonas lacunae TaxID=477680 RepID=A0A173MC64_9BACT|nr:family 78 glycoside hydrolase catalytic domain [Filimonas lacunae]BAV05174.1 alpha-L-rhamnosidase [Filimonas lacunae]SIT22798.1 alpha-L-rhamnosidase [Filimonas lacunae]